MVGIGCHWWASGGAGDDPPGIEETLEPKHRSHPLLDTPVVLLHNVVQVGARADLERAFENGS